MKPYLIIFTISFVIFFFIGLITGVHSTPDKDKVFAQAVDNMQWNVKDNNIILTLYNGKTPIYDYDVASGKHTQVTSLEKYDENKQLFPMETDQLLVSILVGVAGVPTAKELMKAGSKLEGEDKSGKIISGILGAISGYTLGYYLGKPKIGVDLAIKELKDDNSWPPVVIKLLKKRIDALNWVYFAFDSLYVKKKSVTISFTEDQFIFWSGNRLSQLAQSDVVFHNLGCTFLYTQKKYEWAALFMRNIEMKKRSEFLFNDDYFGMQYYHEAHEPSNIEKKRDKYLTTVLKSLNENKSVQMDDVYEKIKKIATKSDVASLTFLVDFTKSNGTVAVGVYKALLTYPNFETLLQMRFLSDDFEKGGVLLKQSEASALKEMISNYPIECMED